jgi:hypothetical protein
MHSTEIEKLKYLIMVNDIEGALREEIRILRALIDEATSPDRRELESTGGNPIGEALETLDMVLGR